MGIHHWSKSAVLTLLVVLSIGHAHAATRKHVSMPSDGQVIGSGNGSSRSGDTLHVPGDGKTEYIPSSYGGGSKGTKLPIKPTYDYSIPRTVKGMTSNLRGGVYGAVLGVGLQYMLDQVDGFIDENQQPVKLAPGFTVDPVDPLDYRWHYKSNTTDPGYATPTAACSAAAKRAKSTYTGEVRGAVFEQDGRLRQACYYIYNSTHGGTRADDVLRYGSKCPSGSAYSNASNSCESSSGGTVPLSEQDYDLMEAAAAAKDSEWLKERLREHCEGGLNPQACYESLRDSVKLEGPSSVTDHGPATTTTSPAGTTTTTESTTIDITYGDNYYDYRKTKTTIVTKPDGTTETTTETEPETEQPREEEEEGSFTDSALPQIEPFYDPIYKVGLGGVWQQRMAEVDNSPFIDFMHSFVPSFASSCPSFALGFNIASWANYGTVSFWSLCWIFDFIKVVMLVTAAFLCRALIFGG